MDIYLWYINTVQKTFPIQWSMTDMNMPTVGDSKLWNIHPFGLTLTFPRINTWYAYVEGSNELLSFNTLLLQKSADYYVGI